MAFNVQASVAEYVAAGYVRITQLSDELLHLLDNYQSGEDMVRAIIDLRQKLEALGQTTDVRELAILLGDLGETYGIPESVYTDPLYRPMLTIPASGAQLRPLVLRIQNGKVLRIQGNKVLALDYRLVPVGGSLPTPPVVVPPPPVVTPAISNPVATPYEQVFTNTLTVQVQHYLGRLALFQLFDPQGEQFEGAVESSDTQQITLVFSQPLSGTIVLY